MVTVGANTGARYPRPQPSPSVAPWLWLSSPWLGANRNAHGKATPVWTEGRRPLWKMRRQSLIQWNFFGTFSRELSILRVRRGNMLSTMTRFTARTLAKHSSAPRTLGSESGRARGWAQAQEGSPPAPCGCTKGSMTSVWNRGQVCSQLPCSGGGTRMNTRWLLELVQVA